MATTRPFPDDGSPPAQPAYFPPIGGFRFGLFTVAPDGEATVPDDPSAAAFAEFEDLLPGLAAHMEPGAPGMHTTATIDFEVVLDGEVTSSSTTAPRCSAPATPSSRTAPATRGATAATSPARLAVFIVGAEHDRVG